MAAERDIDRHDDGQRHARALDRRIGALATGQHGRVARAQLIALGATPGEIEVRVARRRLVPVAFGVYAVGHVAPTRHGLWMAAVLGGGGDAVLSHRAAAALWGIRPSAIVEVTAPTQKRNRLGLTFHRAVIPPDERTTRDGIPVTSAARTLLDLAAVVPRRHLERAVHEAEVQRLTGPLSLHDLLERHRGRRGAARLRAVLGEPLPLPSADLPWHELDRAIASAGLPAPRRNLQILGHECDRVWPEKRLILELDGRAVHDTARHFETDRERDRALAAAGWRTVRVTWRQAHQHRAAVLADLAALLRRRGPAR